MTEEQARRALAALPTDADLGREAAREYWTSGLWANNLVSGFDFSCLFGRVWEESFWKTIDALRTLDPEKAAADLALAEEKYRREMMAKEEERRRKAAERKSRKKRPNPQVRNPLLPVVKVLPMVSSSRWKSQTSRTFRTGRTHR